MQPAWTLLRWTAFRLGDLIVVPLVPLSPVIAFLLVLAAEIAVWTVVDAGAPTGLALGVGAAALFLFRKLTARASQDVN